MRDNTQIPEAMRARDQWLCWRTEMRNGKPTKTPIDPQTGGFGSSTDDSTWAGFETALEYYRTSGSDGIGFVFTESDSYVGIDLDDCRDPKSGRPDPEVKSIIKQLDSYTEVSPSETGYHVILEGDLPSGRNRRGNIELYDRARYFTVTGDRVPGLPPAIESRQPELEAIHREYVDQDSSGKGPSRGSSTLSNEDVLERARLAANGEKFDRLWSGSTAGYASHSEADMALCCLLAFWTGGDRTQMDHLFRQSGLHRAKWDDVHYGDGSTYGERTLERAVEHTTEFYEPTACDVDEGVQKTGEGTGSGAWMTRRNQYLEQKNAILEQRIDALETTLCEKNELILELERDGAKNDRMQAGESFRELKEGSASRTGDSRSILQKMLRRVRSKKG